MKVGRESKKMNGLTHQIEVVAPAMDMKNKKNERLCETGKFVPSCRDAGRPTS